MKVNTFFSVSVAVSLFVTLSVVCFAQGNGASGSIKNVEAPSLAIMPTSVVLIWDDSFEPNYQSVDSIAKLRSYIIYQNGVKVGLTEKRTYTAQRLLPKTKYTFSIIPEDKAGAPATDNAIEVTTKNAGKIFNVKNYGARGDGETRDGEAIQKAINSCSENGIILVPAGRYIVDHLDLKSNLTLQLEKNAVLSFAGYNKAVPYPITKVVLPGPDGEINYQSQSLISGLNVHNVILTGEGTIDGSGESWWPHYKEITRPFTIEFILSSEIFVQGITIVDPPFWNNHLLYVDNAVYSDVKFFKISTAAGVNGDGLNPDASRKILIVGCLFGNQDDCIAIKSGKYSDEGNKRRRSSEYITIRDCVFDGNAAPGSNPLGIAIGSESSGGIKHVFIQNCEFIDVASLANIKANRQRPFAIVDDIRIENISYINHKAVDRWWNRAPISIDLFYGAPEGSNPTVAEPFSLKTPLFKNIHFNNILIYNPVGRGIYISGLAESPIHDISFSRVEVRSRDGVTVQNVDALSINEFHSILINEKKIN